MNLLNQQDIYSVTWKKLSPTEVPFNFIIVKKRNKRWNETSSPSGRFIHYEVATAVLHCFHDTIILSSYPLYILGVKISDLVLLKVIKSKMAALMSATLAPFRVLIKTDTNITAVTCRLRNVPVGSDNELSHAHKIRS